MANYVVIGTLANSLADCEILNESFYNTNDDKKECRFSLEAIVCLMLASHLFISPSYPICAMQKIMFD